ncbi:MAG: DUF4080 domain-containing protein [Firmicutes bacterium]|nr:DUF4080 domain-containing protein [Bacillota bacterium]
MKVLLNTLNSKFIHSSLSIRYIKEYCNELDINVEVNEYTINQNADFIAGEIFKKDPKVVAFSCYIWNIEKTLYIAKLLKKVKCNIKIVLGGPEVSFNSENILKENPYIDIIVHGEGEKTFKELLWTYKNNKQIKDIDGIVYREKNKIIKNSPRELIDNLDSIPSPFNGDLKEYKNKIVYYESSRGCPFNCKFCLSSTIKGVRFFSIDRVKDDLKKLIDAGVKQVKFVDRTFNTNKEFALDIMKFVISKNPKNINFHFEVTAHLIDEEMLDFLKNVPEGLFQFEVGVQTTNEKTIKSIGRTTDFKKLSSVVKRIKGFKNIHQHLDLIAGLPFEDYESFKKSFNDVYNLSPDKLQLGFLKLLKGSELRKREEEYGFEYINNPPYEVIENDFIEYKEILKLKTIEDLVEKYANEISFENTVKFIINNFYNTPFEFYSDFARFWEKNNYHLISHSKKKLYKIIYKFYKEEIGKYIDVFNEVIKYDYLYDNRTNVLPDYITCYDTEYIKQARHNFLQNEKYLNKYLNKFKNKPAKKIINKVHFESFTINIISFIKNALYIDKLKKEDTIVLFDYSNKKRVFTRANVYNVTKEFKKEG